jgi:hypothetical protein
MCTAAAATGAALELDRSVSGPPAHQLNALVLVAGQLQQA